MAVKDLLAYFLGAPAAAYAIAVAWCRIAMRTDARA